MRSAEKHLTIKRSTLPHAGKGLFTTDFIPKDELVVEYKGRITTWKNVDHNNGWNGYIFYLKRNHVIDAKPYKKALARYANDAKGLSRKKGISNNSIYEVNGSKVFIKSARDILPGEEILVDYGKEYWDIIRYNRRLEKRQNKIRRKTKKQSIIKKFRQGHRRAA